MSKDKNIITVALDTLGCKLNQAETESLARQLIEAGYKIVPSDEVSDVYILNTCTVTIVADRKARQLLRMARRRNPGALVIATGCYAERASQELVQIEGIDLVLVNEQKAKLPDIIKSRLGVSYPALPDMTAFRTRAFIKAQDGCNNFCSYCIVPLVRGREKSLPTVDVIREIKQRVAEGYKEAVLTGTEIGAYNHSGIDLRGLLERILGETDIARLRLSSVQPQEVSPELIELWDDSRLCRHFHLSLQSGCDTVLKRMNRRYSIDDYLQATEMIREMVPQAAITTDVIVGFPGETEEEFETSFDFCQRMEFARMHIFAYSKRPGTEAAKMPRQIPINIKKQRSHEMLELARESASNFHGKSKGETMTVLFEHRIGNFWSGYTDNYIKVFVRSKEDLGNKLLPVRLIDAEVTGMFGDMYNAMQGGCSEA